jgi:glycosyltransferase involved in cell wall biosynthesis
MSNGIDEHLTTLDGLTILRYTHATERTGGVEQYLNDLNNALLQRNKMSIIQLYLPLVDYDKCEAQEKVGRGILIKVPMIAQKQEDYKKNVKPIKRILKELGISNIIRDMIVYNPVFKGYFKGIFLKQAYSRYEREPLDVKRRIEDLFCRQKVDLIVIHSAGGWGSSEIIREAKQRGIPYVLLNHFSNERFRIVGFREQALSAAGVGGVSGKNIPKYLRSTYKNLSDGIDTDFFNRDAVKQLPFKDKAPIIMLPSRVVPGKGHRDLLNAARLLKRKGVYFRIVFAGRISDREFTLGLQKFIRESALSDTVNFVGEVTQEELRGWYAASSAVVLPSRNEGLGRVLLEAQAMELPVIAYDVGGVSEAVLDGISGYLVKTGSINRLAARISELVRDGQKRESMGKAGRAFIERNFSHTVLAKKHEEWYLSALESAKRNASISYHSEEQAEKKVGHEIGLSR